MHRRADGLDAPAVMPSSLLLISDRQYPGCDRFNREGGDDLFLSERPDETAPMGWIPVWSLARPQKWFVPAAFCLMRYPGGAESLGGDSNGCAAGRTLEDAIVRGFSELVERDAIALWWYNRVPRPPLDVSAAGGELARNLMARLEPAGRTLHLLELTTATRPSSLSAKQAASPGHSPQPPRILAASRFLASRQNRLYRDGSLLPVTTPIGNCTIPTAPRKGRHRFLYARTGRPLRWPLCGPTRSRPMHPSPAARWSPWY